MNKNQGPSAANASSEDPNESTIISSENKNTVSSSQSIEIPIDCNENDSRVDMDIAELSENPTDNTKSEETHTYAVTRWSSMVQALMGLQAWGIWILEKLGASIVPILLRGRLGQMQYPRAESSKDGIARETLEWFQTRFTTYNLDDMLEQLKYKEEHRKYVISIHGIIRNFNNELRNMHDNYVCFSGERDIGQMNRFLYGAYTRAQEAWDTAGLELEGFSIEILQAAKTVLFKHYDEENQRIILKEKEIALKLKEKLIPFYNEYLDKYAEKMKDKCRRSEFQAVHDRMMAQICRAIGKSFSYGAKFNSVAHEATKEILVSLQKISEQMMETQEFLPESIRQDVVSDVAETVRMKLSEKQIALITKCDQMQKQIENGSVHVGTLSKNIILEAVRNARLAANENMVNGKEAAEIHELFTSYYFK